MDLSWVGPAATVAGVVVTIYINNQARAEALGRATQRMDDHERRIESVEIITGDHAKEIGELKQRLASAKHVRPNGAY